MTSETWKRRELSSTQLQKLKDTDVLLKYLHSTNTELCHGENLVSFANKVGTFLLEVPDVLEASREKQGFMPLRRRHQTVLEERIKFTLTRCDSIRDRLNEMKERLRGQINVVSCLVQMR
jgi:hypothetical protein